MSSLAALPPYWYAACRTQQLRAGPIARTVLGRPLVLFHDSAGRVAALLDRCPHRNAPLSHGWLRADHIVCPYHGWQFDRTGQCRAIPGLCDAVSLDGRSVPSYPVFEQDGLIWLYAGAARSDPGTPPRIDLLQTPGYGALVRDFTVQASLLDAAENFLDPTHTHFVHAGLVRKEAARRAVQATIRHGGRSVEAEYRNEQQSGLIARLFGGGITRTVGRFVLPSTVQMEYWAGDRLKLLITIYFTPQTADELGAFAVLAANPAPLPFWLVRRPFEWMLRRVLRQDQHILAMQSANLRRFGTPQCTSTELDLLRPHLVRLLQGGPAPADATEHHVTLML
jgi:phenylpropionate dioxygenase-like ring-hydroxylating dioxygenase large terminal subunit